MANQYRPKEVHTIADYAKALSVVVLFSLIVVGWLSIRVKSDSNDPKEPNNEGISRIEQESTKPSTDLENTYREAEKASEENQYREKLISFIKRNYEIDPNRLVANTESPLHSSGIWSAEDAANWPNNPSICSTSEVTCEGVTYKSDADQVICYWVIAVYNIGNNQRIYQNDAARFYFRKVSSN